MQKPDGFFLGKILDGTHEEGAHAWYQRILVNLGIKIYKSKSNLSRAIREYIISKYLEPSGCTTVAYALGMVGIFSPTSEKILNHRPAIWMEHINGTVLQDVLDLLIYNECPLHLINSDFETKEKWAYESEQFAPIKSQLERTLINLSDGWGIQLSDHLDNMTNFILESSGLIRVIDFSLEEIPKELKKVIYQKTESYLEVTIPIHFKDELIKMFS